jgi:cellulose synthase/poly-beta-1,6-N-acetylglucosamine synthase-like glycosyltransferase
MNMPEILFLIGLAVVLYTYFVYPAAIALLARARPRPVQPEGPGVGSVSVIVAAYNEEATIGRRLAELAGLVTASGLDGEVILVSDGSTDRTAAIAGAMGPPVRVIAMPVNGGKAAALNEGCAAARGEVLLFADARQRWAPDALDRLVGNFRDPSVGAVGGDLVLEAAPGVTAGVGLYWRYEKWIRRNEGRVHSTVGVTGAISGVRRALFRPIPRGTILDDVYWPLRVVLGGSRVVHEDRARAFDHLPERARDEFRRKVRTLSGNFQLVASMPEALIPWRNPVLIQFVSHKLLRLVIPWVLLAMLACSARIPGLPGRVVLIGQLLFYSTAFIGLWRPIGRRSRLAGTASSFLVLNAAAWFAFWIWISGRSTRSWNKVIYNETTSSRPSTPS